MDEIDKRILYDMQGNCRISYQELSRKYGISANAIRRRILNLEESGIIYGYTIILSPEMTGTEYLFGLLTTDGSRDEVELVEEIGSSKNVIAAAAYTDGMYALVAEYHGAEEQLEVGSFLRRIDGVEKSELHSIVRSWGEKMKLTKTHLRVLEPLLEDPRLPIVEVAKRAGLTARRVRRLVKDLEEGGGLRFVALLELGAATSIPFIVRIRWNEKEYEYSMTLNWIKKEYPLHYWESYVSASEPLLHVLLVADDLTQLTEIVRSIRQAKFVTHVKALIGAYHKFFSSYRREKLVEIVRSASV
ncbi:MAG: winged helix-turn-helix transcriptional regulator [Candidatus Thorarchaeota archaeon]